MTLYRHVNISEYWDVNEIHATKLRDDYWGIQAKLENGRVPMIFINGPQPQEKDEPDLIKQLVKKDRLDRWNEFWGRLWLKLTWSRGYVSGCDCCDR